MVALKQLEHGRQTTPDVEQVWQDALHMVKRSMCVLAACWSRMDDALLAAHLTSSTAGEAA